MKITDIENKYFNHLISHYRKLKGICEDLMGFNSIGTSAELLQIFPSEEILLNMRQSNSELTEKQWEDYWKIIEEMEVNLARARVATSRHDAEDRVFNEKYPIKFDEDGYAYRNFTRDYIEMGG
jgi:hypothetical protein